MAKTFEDPPLLGPRGLVGVPVARFVEPIIFVWKQSGGVSTTTVRPTQVVGEVWVQSPDPSTNTPYLWTQVLGEAWVVTYRQTSRTFDYPKDRMGPQGFLGVVPATFKDRLTLGTTDAGAHPSVGPNTIPDDRYGFGLRGFLGITPSKFRAGDTFETNFANPSPPPYVSFTILDDRFGRLPVGFMPMPMRDLSFDREIPGPGPNPGNLGGARPTQIEPEVWVKSPAEALDWTSQVAAEAFIQSAHETIIWTSQYVAEAWILSTPASQTGIPPFLWVVT